NINQTTLPLEVPSFLPQDHLILLLKKWSMPWRIVTSTPPSMPLTARLITLKCS
ncbi:LOW QUALITY PROTEIN: hypothetical protein HMPREF0850_00674, partial [Streptococcus sp. M143]